MGAITLDPYIFFKGNCREAMGLYKDIFGGELSLQTYADVPGDTPVGNEDLVMHAKLEGDIILFGSDTDKASPVAKKVSLCIGGEDEDRLHKIFDGLSRGGTVISPLKTEFWGDTFGNLTDKFGVEWMVNITKPKDAD